MDNWKVLVLDENISIHEKAKRVLEGLKLDDIPIIVLSAFNINEAVEIFNKNPDIAAMLMSFEPDPDLKIKFINKIREEIKNTSVSITLHSCSKQKRQQFDFSHKNISVYMETAKLTEEKILYLIMSGIRFHKNALSLLNHNRILKYMINSLPDTAVSNSVKEALHINFEYFEQLLKKINLKIGAISFVNGKFFKCTPDMEKYKKIPLNSFIKEKAIDVEKIKFKKQAIIRLKDGIFATLNSNINITSYIKFNEPVNEETIKLLKLYIHELTTVIDSISLKEEMNNNLKEIIFTLGDLIETRSNETGQHVERVADYTYIISKALNLKPDLISLFKTASTLHDIGKIGIPDNILNKPGRLTKEEFEIMKQHSVIGYNILKKSKKDIFKISANVALHHHENYDGSGYPYGIKGNEIPLEARIVSLADYYDALSSDRVYRKAWEEKRILDSIKELKGIKFDPEVVDGFFNNYHKIIEIRMNMLHRRIGRSLKQL